MDFGQERARRDAKHIKIVQKADFLAGQMSDQILDGKKHEKSESGTRKWTKLGYP